MLTQSILNLKQFIKRTMGTWGIGIKDNDTASDVYADLISLLESNSIEQAMEKLTVFYQSKINSYEEQNNFWLAVASAQMDTNSLQTDIFDRVQKIILSGEDLVLWQELKASETDLNLRKEALNEFLILLTEYKKQLAKGI
ncbi:DUF4259 domain-containing protein [Fluviicola sp.]|uniref:DUF4259 domain-containing protein n=1 Tax=Fluviicola sp. TaxID=1917219 RepID=UPI003D2A67D5